ncbi:helix-turn-helix domain-containing protein [Streptomyces sp. HNM0574]|uniref:winged helix-turn-helix transcriptional regulator n=1 Tax=Streptomyces sp. HNM0574 TaxID=2714954 RepID=UPI00146F4ED8|nr:helix-turn-helix domain-containing protein [Streptomyces sp. HNM0574]NLU66737.1 helix-turn-helix transcriptional regulator [Streptomyces sp. HNM0574]
MSPRRPRRSYDQYCALARGLDLVGDRWTLLVVRELLAGPRRYTDLHADLPGVSTDMLATRLKDMERDGLAVRRRLPPPGVAHVYELTERGRELLPVLGALSTWGAAELAEPRPTDAVRAHWAALPLRTVLRRTAAEAGVDGTVDVRLDEGTFHLRLDGIPPYGEGPSPAPDAVLELDATTAARLTDGTLTLPEARTGSALHVHGTSALAGVLRGE